jgi:hypothetical protein
MVLEGQEQEQKQIPLYLCVLKRKDDFTFPFGNDNKGMTKG